MVDVTELMGDNVTIDVVKNNQTDKAVILSAGCVEEYEGKKKLKVMVEFNGRKLFYIPNKTSLKNISDVYGMNSTDWVGKTITLTVGKVNGKDAVLGEAAPMDDSRVEVI